MLELRQLYGLQLNLTGSSAKEEEARERKSFLLGGDFLNFHNLFKTFSFLKPDALKLCATF
jgi:hypothetical protein